MAKKSTRPPAKRAKVKAVKAWGCVHLSGRLCPMTNSSRADAEYFGGFSTIIPVWIVPVAGYEKPKPRRAGGTR